MISLVYLYSFCGALGILFSVPVPKHDAPTPTLGIALTQYTDIRLEKFYVKNDFEPLREQLSI